MDKKTKILLVIGLGIAVASYYFYNQASTPGVVPTLGNLLTTPTSATSAGSAFMQGWDSTINSIFGTSYGQQQ